MNHIAGNFNRALAVPGVVGVVDADDLTPERNLFGIIRQDEPVFASREVEYNGQIVACIVSKSLEAGRRARDLVEIQYGEDLPAILTIPQAIEEAEVIERCQHKLFQEDAPLGNGKVQEVSTLCSQFTPTI